MNSNNSTINFTNVLFLNELVNSVNQIPLYFQIIFTYLYPESVDQVLLFQITESQMQPYGWLNQTVST